MASIPTHASKLRWHHLEHAASAVLSGFLSSSVTTLLSGGKSRVAPGGKETGAWHGESALPKKLLVLEVEKVEQYY